MARIVSIGSATQDIYLIDHDDLKPTTIGKEAIFGKVLVGSEVDIDRLSYSVGGGGINSAISFARYGHETILMTNIARDVAGDAILRALDREEIDSSYVEFSSSKTTGTSIVLLDSKSGERTILACRGISEKFSNFAVRDLDRLQPDWLYVTTLYGDLATTLAFFEKANAMGTKIMFNPGARELNYPRELLRLMKYVDVLILNKAEASKLVPGATLAELLYHLNGYAPIVIITDGMMGGIAGNREAKETYRFGIYEDVKVRDVTGAGDAFGSGFLAAYADGKSFRKSLIFASANSTAVVSKIGANTGILTSDEDLHPMMIQKFNLKEDLC